MENLNCFCSVIKKKKEKKIKVKGDKASSERTDYLEGIKTLQATLDYAEKSSENGKSKSTPFGMLGNSRSKVKVMSHESPVNFEPLEVDYEGEDERDENSIMNRDLSDFDFQAHIADPNDETDQSKTVDMNSYNSFDANVRNEYEIKSEKDGEEGIHTIQGGHLSDPGMGQAEFWTSPKLKRTCSHPETSNVLKEIAHQLTPLKSQSFEELQRVVENFRDDILPSNLGSPRSAMTHYSADKVLLKKHSSTQILPSRNRKLWWKLFLWSHRNMHTMWSKPQSPDLKPVLNQHGGYSSDTLEPNRFMELRKLESPESFIAESSNRGGNNNENWSWDGFDGGFSGLWPQNQWIAFPTDSPLTRVNEWVKELAVQQPLPVNDDETRDDEIYCPPTPPFPAGKKSLTRSTSPLSRHPCMNLPEEIVRSSAIIQSLNASSTVAHISGIGLKVIPAISCFSSLRDVNLSGNLIVHVTTGSLPKGLHSLNLSRNKITTIEGFRELTRLRVLDLSYNRISRIGRGLSNCTLMKELYLGGNKISEVEGLHRLLKLNVLDLSFNKITTAKALGQLVANYSSLFALNLLGNPIQKNFSDDQIRKTVCSLLSKLAYLNKQPIKPQKTRGGATKESIAKSAPGKSGQSSRRQEVKRLSRGKSGHRS